jgi:hypothetical protein
MKGLKFIDKELITEWFRFADDDIDTALLLKDMRPQHYAIILFTILTSPSPPHTTATGQQKPHRKPPAQPP